MKTNVFLALGLAALAAVSCTHKVELKQGSIDKTGTLTVCVNSNLTGTKLEGAKIFVVGSNLQDSTITNVEGTAKLQLPAGQYKLLVKAEGYASIYSGLIEIKPLNGTSETPIFGEMHTDIDMYSMGAKVTGRVVLASTDANVNDAYLEGAKVAITEVNGLQLETPITASTDAQGAYILPAPVNVPFTMDFYYVKDGKNYIGALPTTPILKYGETQQLTTVRVSPNSGSIFDADFFIAPRVAQEALRITFPVAFAAPVDITSATITVSGHGQLAFGYADNNRTLIITPQPSVPGTAAVWTTGAHTFTIDNLKGANGEILTANGTFTIQ